MVRRPKKVKARQWLIFALSQVVCTWLALEIYQGMNSNGYRAGQWAFVLCGPLVALPILYGLGLTIEAVKYARDQKLDYSPCVPKCDLCETNPASWNTRTGEWMDTCSGCRNPTYFDNENMIG